MRRTPLTLATTVGAATLALAACSGTASTTSSSSPSTSPSGSPSAAVCPLTVTDAWVKAVDSGMTAAFGVVKNATGTEVTIVSAATPVSGMTQLHETVDTNGTMKMQQVPAFQVPANGEFTLTPGGNHIMLMDISAPIQPGQDVGVTLSCEGGGTTTFNAQARAYTGANETYQAGSPSPSSGM